MNSEYKYSGLTPKQVEESREKHGHNTLTPPKKASLWNLFLEKFEDPIIRILLVAWILSMIIAGVHCMENMEGWRAFLEPLGIFFAILLATTVGFFFEVKANKAFDVLNTVNDDTLVTVIRQNAVEQIMRKDIVVGDIVILNTGDEVPADGTLLEAVSMQINESSLTGEPIVGKTTLEKDFDKEATYASNYVLRGTTVMDGHGIVKIEKVGDNTEYGKVNQGVQMDNNLDTPLQAQLNRLASLISKIGYAVATITFVILSTKTLMLSSTLPTIEIVEHILHNFMIAVTLIVVSVPEGLPMSVTLSLALSMSRMLKANNLVRKMHACETMGATTVICTDKTGTLTQNQMQVHQTNFYGLKEQKLSDTLASKLIKEGLAVNSTAELNIEDNTPKPIGNPTEGALLLWLHSQGTDYRTLRSEAEVINQLTFSTERKYMATVVKSNLLGKTILYVKGASEILFNNCCDVADPNGSASIANRRKDIELQLLNYQNQAMRTLGFAYRILEENEVDNIFANGRLKDDIKLTFLGIVAISDPVRADVPDAVKKCIKAGINVKIVTGDTPGTAREIARQIGIWSEKDTPDGIITGPEFGSLTDEVATKRINALKIMCRARPTDKQRLVQLLQNAGEVVAVTGDGTNDAPALKAAQVGLSMGDGTSVAKEASDITIIDNSFGSIANAVMWGRSLYRNIQRFLLFQLTINVAACLIVLLGSLLGTESPLTITQMLWVNLIMDTFAAGALASLPPSWSVMQDSPRKNSDFIISARMGKTILITAVLFVIILLGLFITLNHDGILHDHELSLFFTTFVLLQFWNMFNAKAFMTGKSAFANMKESKSFLWVAALILIGQYLIVTFGGDMFNAVPLSWSEWSIIFCSTSIVLWIGELIRIFNKN